MSVPVDDALTGMTTPHSQLRQFSLGALVRLSRTSRPLNMDLGQYHRGTMAGYPVERTRLNSPSTFREIGAAHIGPSSPSSVSRVSPVNVAVVGLDKLHLGIPHEQDLDDKLAGDGGVRSAQRDTYFIMHE